MRVLQGGGRSARAVLRVAAGLFVGAGVVEARAVSPNGVWIRLESPPAGIVSEARAAGSVTPARFRLFALDAAGLQRLLVQIPMEGVAAERDVGVELHLPMPDGTFARFAVVESPIMAPAARA